MSQLLFGNKFGSLAKLAAISPYFFYEFSFIFIFLLIHMNMQSENLHISTFNKKNVWALIWYQGR